VHTFAEQAAVTLAAEDTEATFLPEMGMLGVSLLHQGREFLSLHGGIGTFAAGHTTGLPLLHPWANRLAGPSYAVDGTDVDLAGLGLPDDGQGHPIHGTMLGPREWTVAWTDAGPAAASLRARFDYGSHPELLRAFPFPHDLVVEATVDGALSLTTTVRPTGDVAVPISFGYHPYFSMPGASRADVCLSLPARQHAVLDAGGLPSGGSELEAAEALPIGDRTFDDLYALGDTATIELDDGHDRLVITYDRGYPYAQVFVPPGEPYLAIEPMTALTDALSTGRCPVVRPGETFSARFTISFRAS
jgi:galactose mutarotase-like enzyme